MSKFFKHHECIASLNDVHLVQIVKKLEGEGWAEWQLREYDVDQIRIYYKNGLGQITLKMKPEDNIENVYEKIWQAL